MVWLTERIGDSVRQAMADAEDHLYVVAPYIKRPALRSLLEDVKGGVAVTVVTRWRTRDFVFGASDVDVWLEVSSREEGVLLVHPTLHAKAYIVDCQKAYVGSANCSLRGLALDNWGGRSNRELMICQSPVDDNLLGAIFLLEAESRPVSPELYEKMRHHISKYGQEELRQIEEMDEDSFVIEELNSPVTEPLLASLPKCRSPVELIDGERESSREMVLHDLALIGSTSARDKQELKEHVRGYLTEHSTVQELLVYCREPRWFGEIADWLHHHISDCPTPDRKSVKDVAANLLQWLTWAFPDEYRLERPDHSECFGPRDAAEWSSILAK